MKTRLIATLLAVICGAAQPADGVLGEELAVVQAMAASLNQDAQFPYDFLYYESDFSTSPHVSSSMSNPDRTQFCGLTREKAQSVITQLESMSSSPLEFDNDTAKPAGLRIGHKKLPRFRYLFISRVVFDTQQQQAWVAVDQNGETGALMRLDKVNGQWNKSARCAGWIKTG